MKRTKKHATLRLEALESREMLDGNVVSSVVGDTLFLRGDARANEIEIRLNGDAKLEIVGVGTTINGASALLSLKEGVRNLVIDLKNGNNKVTVGTVTPAGGTAVVTELPGDVTIKTGSGNDTVTLQNVEAAGAVKISTGSRNDKVAVKDLVLTGTSAANSSLMIDAGQGDDSIGIDSLSGPTTATVTDPKNTPTDPTDDVTTATATAAVASLVIGAGTGHDDVYLKSLQVKDVVIDAGQGDDLVDIDGLSGATTATVTDPNNTPTDSTDDVTTLTTAAAASLAIRAGTGHDDVHLKSIQVNDLAIDLHQGNDDLFLDGEVETLARAVVDGGPNKDKIVLAGTNILANATFLGMEDNANLPGTVIGGPGHNGKGPKGKGPKAKAFA